MLNTVGDYPSVPLVQDFSTNLEQEIEVARQVKPPFPPQITPKELIVQKKNGDMPSRSPNAFMIYRKLFVDELHNKGLYLPMTTASSMASTSWKNEPEFIKQEYRRIASEAKSRHLKLYNQIPRRKKNQRKIRNVQSTSWLQIIPQYDQSRSENSTAVSSPIAPSPISEPTSILTEGISRLSSHIPIPYGLSSIHINDNEPTGFYLPQIHQFPVEIERNNSISAGIPSMELASNNNPGFGDHANMVFYDNFVTNYHSPYSPYQQPYELQNPVPQNFLHMSSSYPYYY
ncbi:2828_t:CDS:1 [Funneliformis geosporum]|uniref:16846_t:CDS:1 n=1 Tax=Funneliformis geosporum TaxID=1117311 RepID=A0A9W4WZT9_9GLOM|nr:2828_t:CDS:1 [Funneliformis geosporum]CAI2175883.1 16846_t:CDS:1 [Funneliformis geosporum]